MSRRLLLAFLAVFAALALLGVAGVMSFVGQDPAGPDPHLNRGIDLVSFWAGGEVLYEGDAASLYHRKRTEPIFKALFPPHPPRYPIVYPPPVYQVFALAQPMMSFFTGAKVCQLLLAVFHLVGAALVVASVRALRPWRSQALAAAFVLPGAISMVLSGQLCGFWVLLLGSGLALRARGRHLAAGLALAGLWVKPTLAAPVFLAFGLLGEWRLLAGMILGGAGILAASLVGGGETAWLAYLAQVRHPAGMMKSLWIRWPRQVNLRTLFAQVAPHPHVRSLLGWTGVIAGLAFAVWVALPFRRSQAPGGPVSGDRDDRSALVADLRTGAVLSALLLATPHFFEYDLGMHLFAMAASLAWLLAGHARWPRIGTVLLLVTWLAGLFVEVNPYLHFSLSAISVLAWVVWMAWELRAFETSLTLEGATGAAS
jgi:hypothetical protein